ncbi:MAG: hypothetical protein E7441_00865 [Ruminococcaceae bacterium]|nr:hypothetical protein [Oscillospiraceae bacterium]
MDKINYKRTSLTELYKLALIGAENCTEKNEDGITVINSLKKQLYIKTVAVGRLLKAVDIKEDEMMSISDFDNCNISESNVGTGKNRFIEDVRVFKAMLEDEIKNVITRENDIMARINEAIKSEVTPENIEKLNKSKDELIEKLDEMKTEA